MRFLFQLCAVYALFFYSLPTHGGTDDSAAKVNAFSSPLSEERRGRLNEQTDGIKSAIERAMQNARDEKWATASNDLVACQNILLQMGDVCRNQQERFQFGLSIGALINNQANGNRSLAISLLQAFIPLTQTNLLRGFDESLQLVLLQNCYHLKRWDIGTNVIKSVKEAGIVSRYFVENVRGFVEKMLVDTGDTNGACAMYSSMIEPRSQIEDPDFNYGSALMELSHLYSFVHNYKAQLNTLETIQEKDPGYYETNLSEVAFFRYAGYKWRGDQSNSLRELTVAAEAAKRNPDWVKDELREIIPKTIVTYQKAGLITSNLTVSLTPRETVKIPKVLKIRRGIILGCLTIITFAPLLVIFWQRAYRSQKS